MQYLTYEQYQGLGGAFEEAAFTRNIARANGIIDNATHNRIASMQTIPDEAKALCADLVDYLINVHTTGASLTSKSQTAGSVSESESYTVKSSAEYEQDIDGMICDYLMSVMDDIGVPILYRGCGIG